jgi:hypothetical protein
LVAGVSFVAALSVLYAVHANDHAPGSHGRAVLSVLVFVGVVVPPALVSFWLSRKVARPDDLPASVRPDGPPIAGRGVAILRPSRDRRRAPVVAVSRKRYFDQGGFYFDGRDVVLQARWGQVTRARRDQIGAVVSMVTNSYQQPARRVLVVDVEGNVLMQDGSYFYAEQDLERLATELNVPFRSEHFRSFAALDDAHPGLLRYRWERHPAIVGLLAGPVIIGAVAVVAILTSH